MIKPKKLERGDKIAAVTLSWGGPGAIPARYEAGKKQFEDHFGVKVVEMEHTLKPADWTAKNPKARAEDLMAAFSDPSIQGIVSTIGGDESVRILPYLDLEVIRNNPKVFMGYSDTTITHFACLKAGLVSFYGPSFMAGFAENGGMHSYMTGSLQKTLFSNAPIGAISPNPEGWTVEHLDWSDSSNQMRKRKLNPPAPWKLLQGKGVAKGRLIGGCAEVLEFLKGTNYWPDQNQWDGAILFLETSEEAPAPRLFERWIRNYGSQGILQRLNGIVLGRPGGQVKESEFYQYENVLLKVIRDELNLNDLPILTRVDFGHTDPMFTIPQGISAEIRCETADLFIGESAVR